ncbi:MAG TPA: ATP-binding protein [Longimicrobium sp.]|nr:ATP-binding protein [Longimicrobium sp.]
MQPSVPGPPPPSDREPFAGLGAALFTQSPFSMVIYDPQGRPLAVNPAFERLWNVTLDTVPADYTVLADPILERQGALPVIRRAFQGQTVITPPVCYDISQVSSSQGGRVLWTQGYFYPVRDAAGTLTHVVLTHIDLSERKQAEEALSANEERLRLAQRAAGIGTFDWHIPSGRVEWTEEEERIFGMEPGSFEGTIEGWGKRVIAEDRERMEREMGAAMQRGERELDFAFRITRPDGEVRWIEGSAEFFYGEDGAPLRMVGVNMDVTDRVRLDEAGRAAHAEAERARAAAEEANRAKSEFLAVMSHELRTPLNAIGGYAELIEMGIRGPVTDTQRDDLRRIQQSQKHLLGLINEVLNYTRVEGGALSYEVDDVPLAAVIAGAEAMVRPQVRARALTLAVHPVDPALTARADGEKLQQVLLNLLSNAVKFTPGGGTIELEAVPTDGHVAVHVRDTGIGIPADRLESVFEPFVQVGRSLNNPAEGAGLGLAISRDLARGMGGDLVAQSEPGVGSTFTVILPRKEG